MKQRLGDLVADWVEAHDRSEPDPRTLYRLERRAALESRPAKVPVGESLLLWLPPATCAWSSCGQMSLPAAARTRWELGDGGDVAYLDLGDALLLVPGGVGALRRQVIDAVTEADWQAAASGFGDPDLADG